MEGWRAWLEQGTGRGWGRREGRGGARTHAAVKAAVVVEVLELAVGVLRGLGAKAGDAGVVGVEELGAAGLALLHGLLEHVADLHAAALNLDRHLEGFEKKGSNGEVEAERADAQKSIAP